MAGEVTAEVISFRRPDGPKYAVFVCPLVKDDEDDKGGIEVSLFVLLSHLFWFCFKKLSDKESGLQDICNFCGPGDPDIFNITKQKNDTLFLE